MSLRRSLDDNDSAERNNKRRRRSDSFSEYSNIAGRVTQLVLKNFMCHEHLKVDFNNKITFISGKNGSGKSAILTGLVIGLGGKSSDTNRSSNVKGLISNGKSNATIEITLTNVGYRAYKPEIYGPEITIVRILSENANKYKTLAHNGKVISNKKNELEKILLSFGIKINNPIAVLNQDMARNFLKNSNDKDLYNFFMWSTGLSDLEKKISHNKKLIEDVFKCLKDKEMELEFSSRDVLEIKKKQELKQELTKLQTETKMVQNELKWSKVLHLENKIGDHREGLENANKILESHKSKIQNKDSIEADLIKKKDLLTTKLNKLSEKKNAGLAECTAAKRNMTEVAEKYKLLLANKKRNSQKILRDKHDLQKVVEEMNNHIQKNTQYAAKIEEVAKNKEILEQRIKDLNNILHTNVSEEKKYLENLSKKTEILEASERLVHHIAIQKGEVKKVLSNIKKSEYELSRFAEWMPLLVHEITNAFNSGMFEKLPIGPLGKYIKLKDEKWGPAVENLLGKGFLAAFCVHSSKDFAVIRSIFKKMNMRNPPLVIQSPFLEKVHDVRKFEVRHSSYNSLFSSLHISHPVVANSLIDQKEIELTLLVPTNAEAYPLVQNSENVPVNCKVITQTDLFYPYPNYRSYSLNVANKKAVILQTNKDQLIRDKEDELNHITGEEEKLRMELRRAQEDQLQAQRLVKDMEREITRIKKHIHENEYKLKELINQDEPLSSMEEILRDDIEHRKKAIEKEEAALETLNVDVEALNKELLEVSKKKNVLETSSRQYDEDIASLKNDISTVSDDFRELIQHFEKFKKKIENEDKKVEILKKKLCDFEAERQTLEELAIESGPRLDTTRSTQELEDIFSRMNHSIKELNETLGDEDLEEISAAYESQLRNLESIRSLLSATTYAVHVWQNKCKTLEDQFVALRSSTSANIKSSLHILLRLRNYKVNLKIKHDERKLKFSVFLNDNNLSSAVCMSGGERSYSMVAFILSLWAEMKVPFYFLDEFDVFMDPLNRSMVLSLLMNHANNHPWGQYVFLTPNNVEANIDNNVSLFRMEDPRKE